jgi:hypothetical protein
MKQFTAADAENAEDAQRGLNQLSASAAVKVLIRTHPDK